MVIAGSSYEEALAEAKKTQYPELEWESRGDVGIEDLLLAVSDGAIDTTLIDSNIYSLNSHFYPRAATAFSLPGTLPHAWAFSARVRMTAWCKRPGPSCCRPGNQGRLQAITDAFYTPGSTWTGWECSSSWNRSGSACHHCCPCFRKSPQTYDMDWRLLAAIGYQESHWKPDASSYTGVRGIMMLTRRTASQLGLTDRLDPEQSIEGGARYFLQLRKPHSAGLRNRTAAGWRSPPTTWA